jgi:hypothetical protein
LYRRKDATGVAVGIFIGMEAQSHLPVRLFDVGLGEPAREAECVYGVLAHRGHVAVYTRRQFLHYLRQNRRRIGVAASLFPLVYQKRLGPLEVKERPAMLAHHAQLFAILPKTTHALT